MARSPVEYAASAEGKGTLALLSSSGIRLRGTAAAAPARHLVNGWVPDLDGRAFSRTLEMVALILPLEWG